MTTNWAIDIRIDSDYRRLLKASWLRKVVASTLAAEDVAPGAKLSLVLTNDEVVKDLNRRYRGKDKITDVLSFPLVEKEEDFISPPGAAIHLGEVIISCPQAMRQTERAGHPLENEMALLIVHGVLHVLGYDHQRPTDRKRMRAREQAILAKIIL